jgi:glycosyltransferase involved in cell wall biosynthesis
MTYRPAVSAVINTYNHAQYIEQAIRSVLTQDYDGPIEVVVVDDGSADATPNVVKEFREKIRYVRKENGGQVSAFHAGVEIARGEILAFLDGDDWWEASKIRKVILAFEENPDVLAVGHGYYEVNENGETTALATPNECYKLSLSNLTVARESAAFRIFLGTSRFALRSRALTRVLPVPDDLPFFDNFVFSQAIALGGAQILPEPLCYYRIHSASLYAGTTGDLKRNRMRYRLLSKLLYHLPPRLAAIGVPQNTIDAFLAEDFIDRDRLHLMLEGGRRRETYRIESAAFKLSSSKASVGRRAFKHATLFMALVLPPKIFYSVHSWYGKHNLKRLRRWFGFIDPTDSQKQLLEPKGQPFLAGRQR